MVEITPKVVKRYQTDRLREKAGPKTINDEVQLLIRLCGDQGDLIRATLRRDKALKLALPPSPGRAYSADEKARMLEEAQKLRTPQMYAALALDLNTGLRDKELREIRWEQIDLVHKKALTVGKSKTDAGTGRVIPLNETAIAALEAHAAWYTRRFGECKPEWFVFAFGKPLPKDPTRPITSFKTAWTKVREKAGVKGRWHDNRHTLVTELAESGAGDEVIMSIAGHVSRAMLSRYSHVRMEAKRRALDEIAARQRAADEKRQQEIREQQAVVVSPSAGSGSVNAKPCHWLAGGGAVTKRLAPPALTSSLAFPGSHGPRCQHSGSVKPAARRRRRLRFQALANPNRLLWPVHRTLMRVKDKAHLLVLKEELRFVHAMQPGADSHSIHDAGKIEKVRLRLLQGQFPLPIRVPTVGKIRRRSTAVKIECDVIDFAIPDLDRSLAGGVKNQPNPPVIAWPDMQDVGERFGKQGMLRFS